MTYIRTQLPEPEELKRLIEEQGENAVFKRYRKYGSLQGCSESVSIVNQILYKGYNKRRTIKQ